MENCWDVQGLGYCGKRASVEDFGLVFGVFGWLSVARLSFLVIDSWLAGLDALSLGRNHFLF